jgi:ribosomal protein S18 acetylase RimI-like enzyme
MSLVRIIEDTFFSVCRYWGGLQNAFDCFGPVRAMQTGIGSADLNMVWSEAPLTREDAPCVRQVEKYYERASLPYWWWVFPRAKTAETIQLLKCADYTYLLSMPCLLADLGDLPAFTPAETFAQPHKINNRHSREYPKGHECGNRVFSRVSWMPAFAGMTDKGVIQSSPAVIIRRVANQEDLALWKEVTFAGFDFPQGDRASYDRFTGAFPLDSGSPQKAFLAFDGGRPTAASLLFLANDAAGLYFITTLGDYRRRGIGRELVLATLHHARAAGARFASLQSSQDGLSVYEKAGFKECCRVDIYGRKG